MNDRFINIYRYLHAKGSTTLPIALLADPFLTPYVRIGISDFLPLFEEHGMPPLIDALRAVNQCRATQELVILPYSPALYEELYEMADHDECSTYVDTDGAATGRPGTMVYFLVGGRETAPAIPRWCICLRDSGENPSADAVPMPGTWDDEFGAPSDFPTKRLALGAVAFVAFVTLLFLR
jgi:hypothetical protein